MIKRGQMTLFLIVGFVLILVLGFFLMYTNDSSAPQKTFKPTSELQSLDYMIQRCLKSTTIKGLQELGNYGGYPVSPSGCIETSKWRIPCFFIEKQRISPLPTLASMKTNVERYIEQQLNYCYDDFVFFEEKKKLDITSGRIRANVNFGDTDVAVNISVPLNISTGESQIVRKEYSTKIPLQFKALHQEMEKILTQTQKCEQAQIQYYEQAMSSCGKNVGGTDGTSTQADQVESAIGRAIINANSLPACKVEAFTPTNPTLGLREDPTAYGKDCSLYSLLCPYTTLQMTIHYPIPLSGCETTQKTKSEQKQNLFYYQLYDKTYDETVDNDDKFTFQFATKINPNTEGTCNLC